MTIVHLDEGQWLRRIISFGDYMQGKTSLAKLYVIQALQKLLTTSQRPQGFQ